MSEALEPVVPATDEQCSALHQAICGLPEWLVWTKEMADYEGHACVVDYLEAASPEVLRGVLARLALAEQNLAAAEQQLRDRDEQQRKALQSWSVRGFNGAIEHGATAIRYLLKYGQPASGGEQRFNEEHCRQIAEELEIEMRQRGAAGGAVPEKKATMMMGDVECPVIDWGELSARGLVQRINREILHPVGLAAAWDVKSGMSWGALVAPEGETFSYPNADRVKCDGNHAGPRCGDPECWNDSKPSTGLGDRYIAMGNLLNDPDSTIDQLAGCAFECGLQLQFRLAPKKPPVEEGAPSEG